MRAPIFAALAAAALAAGPAAAAVTQDDFLVASTANLVNLCDVGPQDPLGTQALHFCHGYIAGIADQYQALGAPRPGQTPFYCLPADKRPTRSEAVGMFVAWIKANPAEASAQAVDSYFRFSRATWPCKR